ncbi:MAG: hypothetical protein M3M94_02010, partial [Actinomycetota bacterium]|nr:hypothetical protein [Actinomycetota bacterium]
RAIVVTSIAGALLGASQAGAGTAPVIPAPTGPDGERIAAPVQTDAAAPDAGVRGDKKQARRFVLRTFREAEIFTSREAVKTQESAPVNRGKTGIRPE